MLNVIDNIVIFAEFVDQALVPITSKTLRQKKREMPSIVLLVHVNKIKTKSTNLMNNY